MYFQQQSYQSFSDREFYKDLIENQVKKSATSELMAELKKAQQQFKAVARRQK